MKVHEIIFLKYSSSSVFYNYVGFFNYYNMFHKRKLSSFKNVFVNFSPLLYSVSSFYISQFVIKFPIFAIIFLARIIITFVSAIDFFFLLKSSLKLFFFLAAGNLY